MEQNMSSKYCPACGDIITIYRGRAASGTGPLVMPEFQTKAVCTCGWRGEPADALAEPPLPKPTPKLTYVSIDIETTGLDEDTCQVLEVGAVIDDWKTPVEKLPTFRRIMICKQITGEPFALALNTKLLYTISSGPQDGQPFCKPEHLGQLFARWLSDHGLDPMDVQAAGKNFSSMDLQFLKRMPNFKNHIKFRHRVIDPATLYWRPASDEKLPDTETCMKRAGVDGQVAHTAVEDALAVVKLIRYGIRRLSSVWYGVTTPTCDDGFAKQLFEEAMDGTNSLIGRA
jgi:oligoribonuclease (3'-5' exoribonuclease)